LEHTKQKYTCQQRSAHCASMLLYGPLLVCMFTVTHVPKLALPLPPKTNWCAAFTHCIHGTPAPSVLSYTILPTTGKEWFGTQRCPQFGVSLPPEKYISAYCVTNADFLLNCSAVLPMKMGLHRHLLMFYSAAITSTCVLVMDRDSTTNYGMSEVNITEDTAPSTSAIAMLLWYQA